MSSNNALGYHIQQVLPETGRTSAKDIQRRLHDERSVTASIHDIRKELDLMLKAGLVSYAKSGTPKWGQPEGRLAKARAKLRAPLLPGHPRRMTDGRCAWRNMTPEQRGEFLTWIQETEEESPVAWHTDSIWIAVTDVTERPA